MSRASRDPRHIYRSVVAARASLPPPVVRRARGCARLDTEWVGRWKIRRSAMNASRPLLAAGRHGRPRAPGGASMPLVHQTGLPLVALLLFLTELGIPSGIPNEVFLLVAGATIVHSLPGLAGAVGLVASPISSGRPGSSCSPTPVA